MNKLFWEGRTYERTNKQTIEQTNEHVWRGHTYKQKNKHVGGRVHTNKLMYERTHKLRICGNTEGNTEERNATND